MERVEEGVIREPNRFDRKLAEVLSGPDRFVSTGLDTIQVNIGLTCNLECRHCHVASSPRRKEQMAWSTMESILRVARETGVGTVDITGGAPEMNPHFRRFVESLAVLGVEILVRTNLTILNDPGYEDLPEFFRDHAVHLIASLPCYLAENVDLQRGEHVHEESIIALRKLNGFGYGVDPGLPLDLVYNPIGPHLPPPQSSLESDYRRELAARYGVAFTRLITITNMPIGQFRGDLKRTGNLEGYTELLERSFNPGTLDALMCRRQISVNWEGRVFDCDFNVALRLPVANGEPLTIDRFDPARWVHRPIRTGDHCFGCTAGAGSSCGGALVSD